MPSALRILLCAVGAAVASLLISCGSGNGTPTPALVRLTNVSNTDLTLSLNQTYNTSSVPPPPAAGIISPYISVPPGTYTYSVFSTSGSTLAPSTQNGLGLGTGQSYTTVAYNRNSVVFANTIADDLTAPAAGLATLAVANISPDTGPLSIYLAPMGTSSVTSGATFPAVQGLSESGAANLAAGTYDIFVTAYNNPNDIRLTLPGVVLSSTQIAVLALTSTSVPVSGLGGATTGGGSLVNAVLINQGGTGEYLPNPWARVRVWSAVPAPSGSTLTPAVAVTVPGATVLGSTAPATGGALPVDYAPVPTPYVLVPANANISAITVGGTPISAALPTTAFAAGGDYSIVVYGTAAAPLVAVFADDNLVSPGLASMRVINAGDTASGGPTLLVGGRTAASSVGYGTASGYSGVPAGSNLQVQLISADYNQTITYSLTSGDVYSVFVYDTTQPPIIFEDR
jgi:hypothetical protein